ncbi:MAG: gamma-glutamyl-phosphate reductase, partial [Acetobacteraceae bacterium]|nr:gamma-glutamyl-phosphate reductase [Acetobacteraceae bacterium]
MHIDSDVSKHLRELAENARAASRTLARSTAEQRNAGLHAMAAALRAAAPDVLAANADDLAASRTNDAFRDRLTLTVPRMEAIAQGLEDIAALPDPLGRT